MLGHSSVSLTADTYSHLLDGIGRKAADASALLIPRTVRYRVATEESDQEPLAASKVVNQRSSPQVER